MKKEKVKKGIGLLIKGTWNNKRNIGIVAMAVIEITQVFTPNLMSLEQYETMYQWSLFLATGGSIHNMVNNTDKTKLKKIVNYVLLLFFILLIFKIF